MILFIAFILVPIIEITVIIKVGSLIGAWATVALILLTAVAGTALVRLQGFQILVRAQATMERGELPARELFDSLCLLVAGVMLVTPGFVTDAFGLALLVPGLRTVLGRLVWRALRRSGHFSFHVYGMGPGTGPGGGMGPGGGFDDDVIEGEFREVPDGAPELGRSAGRHPDDRDRFRR